MTAIAIVNAGGLATGDLTRPLDSASYVLVRDGVVEEIAAQPPAALSGTGLVIDAQGALIAPGLIDSHCHVVIGDYTPRQKTVDFLESYSHGGVSRVISASEVHAPGRPRDPVGVKALAIAAQRCFAHYRPGGLTVHAGSVILEPGLTDREFDELAAAGVWLAKAGFGDFARPRDCAPLVQAARERGFIVMCHSGGASIPGSSPVTADDLIAMRPNVSGHANGGPTAMADGDVDRLISQTTMALQVVQAGNLRSSLRIVEALQRREELERLLIATDTPTGTGTMPLAMLKTMAELASLAKLDPAIAIAAATGNVGRAYGLDVGELRVGAVADLVLLAAPLGSTATTALEALQIGDLPAVSCLVTSGELRYVTSRNTPPPARPPRITDGQAML
jgi:enamidase